MSTIRTNRDLYVAIAALVKSEASNPLTLMAYLRNVYVLGHALQAQPNLTPDVFVNLLKKAFTITLPDDLPNLVVPTGDEKEKVGFAKWDRILLEQIDDLRQMEHA